MKPEVSCNNTSGLIIYIRKTKGDEGIAQLLDGTDVTNADYLADANNWISLDLLFHLFDNIREIFNDQSPKLFFELGKELSATEEGALITIAKWVGNTERVIKSSPSFNRSLNVDQEIEVAHASHDRALVINYFLPEFFERERIDQCDWTKGIYAGIPMMWNLPPAEVKEIACSFRLEDVLSRDYGYLELKYEIENDKLKIDGTEYARKVTLIEAQSEKPLFTNVRDTPPKIKRGHRGLLTGEWTHDKKEDGFTGFLVTKDLIVTGKEILLKGEIYNAPYCLYDIQWEKLSFFRNILNRTVGRYRLFFESKRELEKMLILSEQRLFETAKTKDQLRQANIQLQRHAEQLEELVEKRTNQLMEEEKTRRIYQVRAAQADAVARFLHQTSNLVLQPLASTMIVFEDFIEIIEDCRAEWIQGKSEEVLYQELDDSLGRIQEVYPTAQQVINGYRALFHAFYEIYVSTKLERDVNQDLRYIETLVQNKYILTQVELTLELDPTVPPLKLEGGVQSIFLELLHNAARHGAKKILMRSEYDEDVRLVCLSFCKEDADWVTDELPGFGSAANA